MQPTLLAGPASSVELSYCKGTHDQVTQKGQDYTAWGPFEMGLEGLELHN